MLFSDKPSDIGTKLGPKLTKLISETIVATKQRLLDTEHRARVHSMQEVIDRAGHEIADLYRPIVREVLDGQDLPDHIRDHVEKIVSGKHQWQAIAGIAFGASGVPSTLSEIVSNYLAPSARAAIAANPQLTPSPETLAALGAKGTWPRADVYAFSRGQGYSDDITTALLLAAYAWPDVSMILELTRRDIIDLGHAKFLLTRAGINPEIQGQILQLREVILSPADLADMVVRGIKGEPEAAKLAAESGVSGEDFHALVLDTGEPLALMQLLEAYRRGFIDESRLVHGIRQSRIRNEWVDVAEKLRFSPMSVADAVNASVQNHISKGEAARIAEQNGLIPGAFETLYETAGEPLSRTEMSELVNRGEATEAQFVQAMRESRAKDKYIGLAFKLRRRLPPPREIETALRHGAITQAEASRMLADYGYDKEGIKVVTGGATGQRADPYEKRVISAIETLYEDAAVSDQEARHLLSGLKVPDKEIDLILRAAGYRREAHLANQVTNLIRSRMVAHHIDRGEASTDLDALGIPHAQRDRLLALWEIERDSTVRTLTYAQIVKAVKKHLITPEEGLTRLENMGYTTADAELLMEEI